MSRTWTPERRAASKKALADPAVRAKMSAARKKAWADPAVRAKMSAARKKRKWTPPLGAELLFDELRRKVGKSEARRLVEDHARARGIS